LDKLKLMRKPTYEELEEEIHKLKSTSKENRLLDHYNMLLKASEDMITIHEPSGKYIYYNGPTCYTVTPNDIVGKMPNDLFNEDISSALMKAFEKVIKTGKSETIELQLDWLGQKKWFSEYIFPFKNTDGEVIEMVKVCKDIDNRKIAELEIKNHNIALLQSEKSYRDVVEASSELISVINRKGEILFINHISEKFYGLTPKKCIGRSVFDFIHPDDKEYTKGKFSEWESSGVNNFQFKNRKINIFDEVFETEWNVNVHRKGKEIIKITSIIRDITAQNLVQQKLIKANKEREEFLNFFNLSPDIMVIANPNGGFKAVNPATVNLLGYSKEEIMSKPFIDFVHPDDKQDTLSEIKRQIKLGTSVNFENRYLTKKGKYLVFSWNAYFSKEEGCTYATARDITNEKRVALELLEAKDKAEESDRLKSAFLSNMSHEIRTPMNGILGFSDLLKTPNLSGEEQEQYIQIIEESGKRMLNVLNDIVSVSKIESGLMEVNIKETNINEQMDFVYAFFKPEVEEKGIRFLIKKSLSGKEALIQSDSEKVYGVLTNLVKNAIKFTKEGTIEIGYEVKTRNKSTELEFYVKDSGIGIPKDRHVPIFDRFIQADVLGKMAYQGAGLGLSISKAYIQLLGGRIWVVSKEGKGSIFYFTLPCLPKSK
jgi:PAS domain S-box-containing protein